MNRTFGDTDQVAGSSSSTSSTPVQVGYVPVLDVARGSAAGYQAVALDDGGTGIPGPLRTIAILDAALAAFPTLPANTFISIPVPLHLLGDRSVRAALAAHGDLAGIVLDITDFTPSTGSVTEAALAELRGAGVLISVGGRETAQPELGSIVRLRPSIVRLGKAWVEGLDQSAVKRSAIEVTGRLTAQLDAWILAEDVSSAAELRALSELSVPLAQGPFIGSAQPVWSSVRSDAHAVLPGVEPRPGAGTLRGLVQQAYTSPSRTAAAAALPDSSGHESVMVIDDHHRPVELLSRDSTGGWHAIEILTVNVDTPVPDALSRAMARPPERRFTPLVCTEAAGRFVGLLTIERLIARLTEQQQEPR